MKNVSGWFAIFAVSIGLLQSVNCEVRSVYFIPEFKANWFKAVEHCNSIDTRLATLDRKEFNDQLKAALITSHVYQGGNGVVWVGGNDLAEEGKYVWRASGKSVDYTNWANTTPDNSSEHCVEFGHTRYGSLHVNWQWNDNICSKEQFFACQLVTI